MILKQTQNNLKDAFFASFFWILKTELLKIKYPPEKIQTGIPYKT